MGGLSISLAYLAILNNAKCGIDIRYQMSHHCDQSGDFNLSICSALSITRMTLPYLRYFTFVRRTDTTEVNIYRMVESSTFDWKLTLEIDKKDLKFCL